MNAAERVDMKINEVIDFINRLPVATKEQRIIIFKEFVEQSKQNALQRESNLEKFKAVFPELEKGNFKLNHVTDGDLTEKWIKEYLLHDVTVEQYTAVLNDIQQGTYKLREVIPGDVGQPVLVRQ